MRYGNYNKKTIFYLMTSCIIRINLISLHSFIQRKKMTHLGHIIIAMLAVLYSGDMCAKGGNNISKGTLGRIYDSYKTELKESYNTKEQDFLDDSASFRLSKLYDLCRKMPKGSDLHVHGSAMLPADMLVDFVKDHPALKVNTKRGKMFGKLEYAANSTILASDGYVSMQEALAMGFTVDDFEKAWTLKGSDGARPWDWFNGLFRKMSDLTYDISIEEDYYTRSFEYYIKQGVTHIEPRLLFFGTHQDALEKARAVYRAQNKARQINPEFSASIVFCGLKAKTDDYNKSEYNDELFENGIFISQNIKDTVAGGADFVVGFDLVNEEDQSIPLTEFESLVKHTKEKNPSLHVTLHAGETTKKSNHEIASAVSLGAERIGHGFNLHMHPDMEKTIKRRHITLEVCPISNKTLGYCTDLIKHPATKYIQDGLDVALGDDDPAYQMRSSLVDDVFVAAALWNLSLDDMKELFKKSITSSFLPKERKKSTDERMGKAMGML